MFKLSFSEFLFINDPNSSIVLVALCAYKADTNFETIPSQKHGKIDNPDAFDELSFMLKEW